MSFYYFTILCLILYFTQYKVEALDADSHNCKEKDTYGYGYTQLFRFSQSSFKDGNLIMEFLVKAQSDAHILLATDKYVEDFEPVYEIVIGAGKNRFSDIRRMKRSNTRASTSTPNLLSAVELRRFWIKFLKDGTLEVGKEGEDIPFIFWKDEKPLSIRYFGFSTWTDVYGKWYYDCNVSSVDESIEVKRSLTWTEKLRQDLLTHYDPLAIPKYNLSERLDVGINFNYQHIDLDAKKAEITISGYFGMTWKDDKLLWDPSQYGSLETLRIGHGEIWRPELVLYNAVGHGAGPMGVADMIVSSTGSVNWAPISKLEAHCAIDLSAWPWDEHNCELQLGLWASQSLVQLAWNDEEIYGASSGEDLYMYKMKTTSGWHLIEMKPRAASIETPWYSVDQSDIFNDKNNYTALVIEISLRRISTLYNYILLLPLIVVAITCIVSFGIPSTGMEKIGIQCLCLILCSMFILAVDRSLPSTTVQTPYLFIAYGRIMILLTLSTVVSVFVTALINQPHPILPPRFLVTALQYPPLQFLFCLPETGKESKRYGQMEELEDENMEVDVNSQYCLLLASAIDRIMLFVTILSLLCILCFS